MRFVIAVIVALSLMLTSRAADQFKLEEGYASLFNGRDLTGWKYPGPKGTALENTTQTPDKRMEVKDGIILVNEKDAKGKGGIKDLYTVADFNKDFHLKLEFWAAPRSDSGVYIRGRQLQVRDYPTVGPYKSVKFNNGDWNELEITVKGTVAECKCNGEVIEKAFKVPGMGGIGLQAETGQFKFRRIRIKESPVPERDNLQNNRNLE
jgi:hypothetical protein